jgi:AmmeMemoRadiSam system protein B/AmmeMemoRadiSam system protein A
MKIIYAIMMTMAFITIPGGCQAGVKEPAVAGSFYPGNSTELKLTVEGFLSKAEAKPVNGKLIALIAPHAGYMYSGGVAGYTYKRMEGSNKNLIILIGASHRESFSGVAVYAEGSMKTPLGNVRIDEKTAKSLINENEDVAFNRNAFAYEHSLEVQLPFLQTVLKDFSIVPILIGSPTRKSYMYLTDKLTQILRQNDNAIIVVSTDLSHYHDGDTAEKMDNKVIDAVERMSLTDLEKLINSREGEMCGSFPVIYAMSVARALGATNSVLYKYAHSGDVTGDKRKVVGYAAMGIYKTALTEKEKKELLSLARNTIINHVNGKKSREMTVTNPRFKADGATFVTIKDKKGNLRGCIGNIIATLPLHKSVMQNAVSSCSKDPRFFPVKPAELEGLEYEVTVLSPLEPLDDVKNIKVGVHGLYLEKGMKGAVFLPQVPVEQGWDLNTYLEQLCLKAGLSKDGWKDAKLSTFTAEIIK